MKSFSKLDINLNNFENNQEINQEKDDNEGYYSL